MTLLVETKIRLFLIVWYRTEIQDVPFKMQPIIRHIIRHKMKWATGLPLCNRLSDLSCNTRVRVTLVARPLLTQVAQKLCIWKHGVMPSRTCVLSRTSLDIVIICCCSWAFSNASPFKEVRNRKTISSLVRKFRDTEMFVFFRECGGRRL